MLQVDMLDLLRELCTAGGVNGLPHIAELVKAYLSRMAVDVHTDAGGNVLATLPAAEEGAPTVLLEAHMDEIGFIVTGIEDSGFLRVAPCGGVDLRCLAATPVVVWGNKPLIGVFCAPVPHLQKPEDAEKAIDIDDLLVDVGLHGEDAKTHIPLGTRVSFAPHFAVLHNTLVTSKALDNRAGVAAVLYALSLLQGKALPYTIKILMACGEELGSRGAIPGAYAADADAAIITDVSFAYTPDAPRTYCGNLSEGVMIGIAPTLDAAYSDILQRLAAANDIPYQLEVLSGKTGTDADAVSIARAGVRTALLSIPQRYMHTPVEVVDTRDVCAVGKLMAAFIEEGPTV